MQTSYLEAPNPLLHIPISHSIEPELRLEVVITQRSYEEREQYVIYDTNSFIADVGGYMGLLLGCSLMSLYNDIEALFKKLLVKPFLRKTRKN